MYSSAVKSLILVSMLMCVEVVTGAAQGEGNTHEQELQHLIQCGEIQEAFFYAAQHNVLSVIPVLIEKNVDFQARDKNRKNCTALMLAARENHIEMVKLLLAYGANKEVPSQLDRTALTMAAVRGHIEVVQLLLADRPYKEVGGEELDTALMATATAGRVDVMQLLIDSGAKIDATCQGGLTGLFLAAENNHIEAARLLLLHGANTEIAATDPDFLGVTPLIHAVELGYADMVRLLAENKANLEAADQKRKLRPLARAAFDNSLDVVEALLGNQANIEVTLDDYTSLNFAVHGNNVDVARALLSKRADVNTVGEDKRTAVMVAARQNCTEMVRLLIDHGACVETVGQEGNTALSEACKPEIAAPILDAYYEYLQQAYPVKRLLEIKQKDGLRFYKTELGCAVYQVFCEVGEEITHRLADDEQKKLLDIGSPLLTKSVINGKNIDMTRQKKALFRDYIDGALKRLAVATPEELAVDTPEEDEAVQKEKAELRIFLVHERGNGYHRRWRAAQEQAQALPKKEGS